MKKLHTSETIIRLQFCPFGTPNCGFVGGAGGTGTTMLAFTFDPLLLLGHVNEIPLLYRVALV